jgi:hypothetical protein
MFRGDPLDELVQLGRLDTPAPRRRHAVDRLEQPRRALAGRRRDVQQRCIVEKLQLPPERLVEGLHELGTVVLHQVPFVRRDDHAASRLVGFSRDGRVLVGRPLRGVDDKHDDVRRFDRSLCQQHADRLHLSAARHPSRPPDSRRVDDAELAAVPGEQRVDRVARRPRRLAHDHSLFAQQPIDERRLTRIRPADDRDRDFLPGNRLVRRLGRDLVRLGGRFLVPHTPHARKAQDDLVEQIADPDPVLGGNLEHRIEPELIEVDDAGKGAAVIRLVDGEHRRLVGCAQRLRDLSVAADQPLAAIYNEDKEIRVGDRAMPALQHQLVQRIFARAEHAAGVGQLELRILPLDALREDVTCRPGDGGDDRAPRMREAIEECRLADVGAADEHDGRKGSGHRSVGPLGGGAGRSKVYS